jgi:hypothetical protein
LGKLACDRDRAAEKDARWRQSSVVGNGKHANRPENFEALVAKLPFQPVPFNGYPRLVR